MPEEPWGGFLRELDELVSTSQEFPAERIQLHCFGGFVVTTLYSLPRATNDLDVLTVVPFPALAPLLRLAGPQSDLAKKHGVYIDAQGHGVGLLPSDYDTRLIEMWPSEFSRLRLLALEVHDLVLSKLDANRDRDREDVAMLAKAGVLDVATFKDRYERELRPYMLAGTEERNALTRDLWVEMIEEIGGRSPSSASS